MNGKRTRVLSELIRDLQSDDREIAEAASQILEARRDATVVDHLVELLRSPHGQIRNRTALVLRKIGDNRAIEPLMTAIQLRANKNNNGTLIYALQTLDCQHLFSFLFDLVIDGNYEVECMALAILKEQEFEVTPAMLAEAKHKLDEYSLRDHARPECAELAKVLQFVLVNISKMI